jgi:glyoxylase-like metal-dependent hydrolase (beta-lactamase superfamily II)
MEEVIPGVWLIRAENGGRFPYAHALFLEGESNILIDTGAGRGLRQVVGRVERVILSHYHRDHVNGNALFPGASFWIHPLDAPGIQTAGGFFRLSGIDRVLSGSFWDMVKQIGFQATEVAGPILDRERIDLGRATLQVLHTPGHTPGHCAFLVEEHALVFAADIDLTPFGPWYGNVSSDPDRFRASIRLLRDLKPALFLSCHCDPVVEKIDQRLAEFAAVIDRREEIIHALLRREQLSLAQIVERKPFYGRHPYPEKIYRFFESVMIAKHLESLERRGLARRQGEVYTAV